MECSLKDSATVIGVGTGIATYRNERKKEPAPAAAGAIRTISSFALFILLPRPGLRFQPVLVAFTMYRPARGRKTPTPGYQPREDARH